MNCPKCNQGMKKVVLFTSVEWECNSCGKPTLVDEEQGIYRWEHQTHFDVVLPIADKTTGVVAPTVTYKPGQWVRTEGDELVKLVEWGSFGGDGWKVTGGRWFTTSQLRPALPRKGEWWEKKPCNTHQHVNPGEYKWKWTPPADAGFDEVECGCLIPVNFGRGPENHAGASGS